MHGRLNRYHLGLEFKSCIMKIRYYFEKRFFFRLKNNYNIFERKVNFNVKVSMYIISDAASGWAGWALAHPEFEVM